MSVDRKQLLELQLCQQEIVKIDVDIKKLVSSLLNVRNRSQRELMLSCKEIKGRLKLLESKVDDFEELASKLKQSGDRNDLLVQIGQHRAEIDSNKQNLRSAIWKSMQLIESGMRDSLFEKDTSEMASLRFRKNQSSNLRQQSSKMTDNLSQLVSKMGDQVKLSEETTSTLVNSSSVLQNTEKEFGTMGGLIQSGGKLLSKYSRRELTDKILIFLTLCLFFGVVFYILRKRVFRYIF